MEWTSALLAPDPNSWAILILRLNELSLGSKYPDLASIIVAFGVNALRYLGLLLSTEYNLFNGIGPVAAIKQRSSILKYKIDSRC